MKAIDILNEICKGWLNAEYAGTCKGSSINANGLEDFFGVKNNCDFGADDAKEYFFYYADEDENLYDMPVDDAWIFPMKIGTANLYLWEID